MRLVAIFAAFQLAITLVASTPMDQKIPEEQVTTIETEFKYDEVKHKDIGPRDDFESDGGGNIFHYKVFLPKGYHENPQEKFPCILVASPGGDAPMMNIEARMKKDRWIVIMLVESKNGPMVPCLKNFLSAHDDAVQRFRILEGMKYATGFSGGARVASVIIESRPGFAGVILQGAGFLENTTDNEYRIYPLEIYPHLAVYMIVGNEDSNKKEIGRLSRVLPRNTRFKSQLFDGAHDWAPAEKMDQAFDWLEEQLLGSPILEKDRQICINILSRQLPKAFEAGSDFEKFEKMSALEPLVKLHKLDQVPELTESLAKMDALVKSLKTDKNIIFELKAKTAFQTVLKNEEKARDKIVKKNMDAKKSGKELKKLLPAYQQVVKTFGNTVYGAKAKEKVETIEKEIQ